MSSCSQCGHRVTQTQTQCSSSKTYRTPTSGCLLTMLALELVPVCSSLRVDTVGDEDDDEDEEDGEGGPPICGMDTHGMCHRCPK